MPRRRDAAQVLFADGDLLVTRDAGRPSGRLLRQGEMDASYVDLADPGHLEFDYLRRMRDLVEAAGAQRIVHVGGAGCALARALAAGDDRRAQEVVEVDAGVLAVAREHLGLRRVPGLRVRHEDGRRRIAALRPDSVDAVLVDAFVGARVPRHLVTREALGDIARVCGPGGVAAVNVVDRPPWDDVRAIGAGLREAFTTVAVLLPGARRAGNAVLVAGRAGLPLERLRTRAAADPSPARLLYPDDLAELCCGAVAWRE